MTSKIAYITNVCSHYRVGLYEKIASQHNADFYFFSEGNEWYAEKKHDRGFGRFNAIQLRGFNMLRGLLITSGLPSRLFLGGYSVFIKCINGKFVLPVTYLIARLLGRPFILVTGLWMHPGSLVHRLTFPLVRYIYTHSDAVIVYGEHVKKYLIELGVKPNKIFVGFLAVNNALFNKPVDSEEKKLIRKRLGIGDKKVILYVGRISPEKGLEYLVEAYVKLKQSVDAALLIVGDGTYKVQIVKEIREQGIQDVFLVDYVLNSELYRYYAIGDVFVLPSVTTKMVKETWGLVINEAMNQGCPVVATDAVGAAVGGLLEDGKTGFIVPEKNSEKLAEGIRCILTDESLHLKMETYIKERISRWDYDQMAKGYTDAIRSVLI
ncbi:glycosyltransferase family 4 protein [bacterium]|nr:MAG: glycosyltransferase family 4 protein [bacterium]